MTDVDVLSEALAFVAGKIATRYTDFVERGDVYQELALYVYGDGKKIADKAVEDESERHRLYLALFGVGRQFAEREKAVKSGYDYTDIAWYTPEQLEDLLPFATDKTWDGLMGEQEGPQGRTSSPREGGTLLAMIVDLRRALAARPAAAHVVTSGQSGEVRADALKVLAQFLGGEYPAAPSYGRAHARRQSATTRKEAA